MKKLLMLVLFAACNAHAESVFPIGTDHDGNEVMITTIGMEYQGNSLYSLPVIFSQPKGTSSLEYYLISCETHEYALREKIEFSKSRMKGEITSHTKYDQAWVSPDVGTVGFTILQRACSLIAKSM